MSIALTLLCRKPKDYRDSVFRRRSSPTSRRWLSRVRHLPVVAPNQPVPHQPAPNCPCAGFDLRHHQHLGGAHSALRGLMECEPASERHCGMLRSAVKRPPDQHRADLVVTTAGGRLT